MEHEEAVDDFEPDAPRRTPPLMIFFAGLAQLPVAFLSVFLGIGGIVVFIGYTIAWSTWFANKTLPNSGIAARVGMGIFGAIGMTAINTAIFFGACAFIIFGSQLAR